MTVKTVATPSKKVIAKRNLVKQIIANTQGRMFTITAKRKAVKVTYVHNVTGDELKAADYKRGIKAGVITESVYTKHEEHFMTYTGMTGVKKHLKGGVSTIKDVPDLISFFVIVSGKENSYKCFSADLVTHIKADGNTFDFKILE